LIRECCIILDISSRSFNKFQSFFRGSCIETVFNLQLEFAIPFIICWHQYWQIGVSIILEQKCIISQNNNSFLTVQLISGVVECWLTQSNDPGSITGQGIFSVLIFFYIYFVSKIWMLVPHKFSSYNTTGIWEHLVHSLPTG
jgi:hypothetical protein